MNPAVYRTSHQLICELLRGVLRDAVQAGPGAAGGIGSVECQAMGTLYLLLMDHPIDPRGRCRSCHRPGAVFGPRWRRCRVHAKATLCLHQLDEVLLLAHELGLAAPTPPAAPGRAPASAPDDTGVLPTPELDSGIAFQTPAAPPTPTAAVGRRTSLTAGPGMISARPTTPASAPSVAARHRGGTRDRHTRRARAAPRRPPVSWYLQSHQDHDTHQGTLNRGMVSARCDIQFVPLTIAFGRKALPGDPPDPDQICPECLRKVNAR